MRFTLVILLAFFPVLLPAATLKDTYRLGRIIDSQGITSLRPAQARRWTLVEPDLSLRPGDWLRTDVRGAARTGSNRLPAIPRAIRGAATATTNM